MFPFSEVVEPGFPGSDAQQCIRAIRIMNNCTFVQWLYNVHYAQTQHPVILAERPYWAFCTHNTHCIPFTHTHNNTHHTHKESVTMPVQAPQWSEFLSCPVCQNEFEVSIRIWQKKKMPVRILLYESWRKVVKELSILIVKSKYIFFSYSAAVW